MNEVIRLISLEIGYSESETAEMVTELGYDVNFLGMDEIEDVVAHFE